MTDSGEKLRQKHAEEFGINLGEFDKRNKQTDTDLKGGKAILGTRKGSFSAKPGDKDTVTPREAAAAFLDGAEM